MLIKDILKGYKIGTPQVSGIMRVIPIIAKTEFTAMTNMEEIHIDKDVDYGILRMSNGGENVSVIPHGLMYVVSEQAQDRVIPSAHLIKGIKEVGAKCLQPSQGGYMASGKSDREWGILPASLKISAWQHANENRYDSMWGDMEIFLRNVGIHGRELIQFFREFQTDLEEFVAQFEPVKDQVGAFFVMNNTVVGIEIVPNYDTWKQMWRPLVRDCYGSEAVQLIKKGHSQAIFKPVLPLDEIVTMTDLEKQVNKVIETDADFAKGLIVDVASEDMVLEEEQSLENFTLYRGLSDNFMGQIVKHGPERVIYVSAVLRGSSEITEVKKPFDSRWNEASPYRNDESFNL